MAVGTQMQQRRASEAVWNTTDYILADGELGVTTDSGIIKIGDGVNSWSELDPAFSSQFLPILGKAADSELLDGINSSGFLQLADATTDATSDKIARRLGDGRLKAVTGISTDDVVNYAQMIAADSANRKNLLGRNTSSAITLQASDINTTILVSNPNRNTVVQITIPTNATVPIDIGSWVDVYSFNIGTANIVPIAGVALRGDGRVYGNYGVVRLLKVNTDTWLVSRRIDPVDNYARAFAYMNVNSPVLGSGWKHVPLNAESYDSHNGHVTGAITGDDTDSTPAKQTNRFTCPVGQAGLYKCSGMVSIFAPSATRIHARFLKNGVTFPGCAGAGANITSKEQALTGEKLIELAELEYVGLQGYCEVANWNFQVEPGSEITSWMNIERIA
jgi:hypothetical protein